MAKELATKGASAICEKGVDATVSKQLTEKELEELRETLRKTETAGKWGLSKDGENQAIVHLVNYSIEKPDRIPSLESRLGQASGTFSLSEEGLKKFTEQAERVIKEAKISGNVREINGKTFYYIDGVKELKKGVIVIKQNEKLQTMMPSIKQYFTTAQ